MAGPRDEHREGVIRRILGYAFFPIARCLEVCGFPVSEEGTEPAPPSRPATHSFEEAPPRRPSATGTPKPKGTAAQQQTKDAGSAGPAAPHTPEAAVPAAPSSAAATPTVPTPAPVEAAAPAPEAALTQAPSEPPASPPMVERTSSMSERIAVFEQKPDSNEATRTPPRSDSSAAPSLQAGPRDSLSLAAVGDKLGAAAEAAAAEVQPATTPPPAQPEKKHDLPDEDDSPKDRAQKKRRGSVGSDESDLARAVHAAPFVPAAASAAAKGPTVPKSEEPVESTAVKVQQPAEAQPVPDDAAVPADRPAAEQSSMSTGSNGNGTAAGSGASGNTGRGNKRKKNRGGKGKKGGAH